MAPIDPLLKRTRVTVKVLEGKNLLVSDLLTGTSDPITFLWVSSTESGYVHLKHDRRVQVRLTAYSETYVEVAPSWHFRGCFRFIENTVIFGGFRRQQIMYIQTKSPRYGYVKHCDVYLSLYLLKSEARRIVHRGTFSPISILLGRGWLVGATDAQKNLSGPQRG